MLLTDIPLLRSAVRVCPVDIVDETYIHVPPEALSALVADPVNHRQWWPHLSLHTTRDRGVKGQRWAVVGRITGSMEIWLEPFRDGVILHHYVRGHATGWRRRSEAARHTLRWKRVVTRLKDSLEGRAL